MEKLRPHLRSAAAVVRAWRGALRRLPRASRFGIAARLSFAFGAVAILTVAANQIAERGNTLLSAIAAAPVVTAGLDDGTAELLPAALDQFQRAVLARVESPAVTRVAGQTDATAALDEARKTYTSALRPNVSEPALAGLEDEVMAHAELGAQVVRAADARRRLLNEMDIEFQSLDGRVKSSLDRVWAVFGKVVGRDYLRRGEPHARRDGALPRRHGRTPRLRPGHRTRHRRTREGLRGAPRRERAGHQPCARRGMARRDARQPRARRMVARTAGAHGRPAQGNERGLCRKPRRACDVDPPGPRPVRIRSRAGNGTTAVRRGPERCHRAGTPAAHPACLAERRRPAAPAGNDRQHGAQRRPAGAATGAGDRTPLPRGVGRRRAARRRQGARHAGGLLQPDGRAAVGGAGTGAPVPRAAGGQGRGADAPAAAPCRPRPADALAEPAPVPGPAARDAGARDRARCARGSLLHRPRQLQERQRQHGPRIRRPRAAGGGRAPAFGGRARSASARDWVATNSRSSSSA